MEKEVERIKELVRLLREASYAYYEKNEEIMSNFEYDRLEAELASLEEKTGVVLAGSPTQRVGGSLARELPKEVHERPMLSLAKTKESIELASFLGENEGVLSWKLDGLTVVLTYENGKLAKAATRGNGQVGELITENARMFKNLPVRISFKGKLVVRGEAVISYSQFEKINAQIEDVQSKYKNPRNLCSGSVRQLDSNITRERGVEFYAFSLAKLDIPLSEKSDMGSANEGLNFEKHSEQLKWLASQGFDVVEYVLTKGETVEAAVSDFEKKVMDNDFPSDGLVLRYNDIAYGESLGSTDKYPRDSMAFKWKDEIAQTQLKQIIWSASRTGLINPIALFEPVELEGTTVSRASVHNVSILRELKLGIGDKIAVYKANMIIPQIAENFTKSDSVQLPELCPSCNSKVRLRNENGVSVLVCDNPVCPAKQIKSFTHFVSRNAMNIEGLSEMSLEKLIDSGFISEFADIFKLQRYEKEIIELDGFGKKSYENLISAVENARKTSMARLIFSLGISNIGSSNARSLAEHFNQDINALRNSDEQEIMGIFGIGRVLAKDIADFFADEKNCEKLDRLLFELEIEMPQEKGELHLAGQSFVITGSLVNFENRDALKAEIEKLGGKVATSVSKNTICLINNDVSSNSSKNKKAKELGVRIISEADFVSEFLQKS